MQTRKGSALEAITNTGTGYVLSVAAGFIIYPLMGVQVSASQNMAITLAFTGVSLARTYGLRRLFNWLTHRRLTKA